MAIKDIIHNKEKDALRVIAPVVNIYEKENQILLEAEVPGAAKDSISVEINNDELEISSRREIQDIKGMQTILCERIPCEYRRSFILSKDIDKDSVSARFENGVIYVTLSKTKAAQPKKIQIQ